MTTYALEGISYDWRDNEDWSDIDYTSYDPSVTLDIIAAATGGFTYTLEYDASEDDTWADITIRETYYIALDEMVVYPDDLAGSSSAYGGNDMIMEVTWTYGGSVHTSTILELDVEYGDDDTGHMVGTDFYFVLDGDPLPDFASTAEAIEFMDTDTYITGVKTPTGDFAPGEFIPWSDLVDIEILSEDDDISGTAGRDVLSGGAGDDYFLSSEGNDTYKGGAGTFDQVSYKDDPSGVVANLATGKATDGWGDTDKLISIEMLRGSLFDDTLTGDKGDNHIRGLAGDDVLNGGKGTDTVRYDRDANYGGTDGVTVNLKKGFAIDGFGDRDTLKKFENVRGTDSKDTITGTKAANDIRGEAGADVLKGLGGKDVLEGGGGNDKLYGGNGKDVLYGGNGKDKLDGGKGDDDLYGGAKTDIFIFSSNFGNDTIHDFRTKGTGEKIDLSGVTSIKNFKDLSNNHLSEIAGNTVIDDGSGNTITLDGVAVSDLAANDFLF